MPEDLQVLNQRITKVHVVKIWSYQNNSQPDGSRFYGLQLVYVNDVLEIIHDLKIIMEKIGIIFDINNEKYGPPTRYLGVDVEKFQL